MDRYPHSIVWTPLPVITWLIPLIGHTGIGNSEGIIYDFGGSYYIAVDNFSFGRPTKYLRLDPEKIQINDWNDAILKSANTYSQQPHNLIVNNCHSHVADTLNAMKYDGKQNYTQFDIFLMITFQSKYVGGLAGFIKQWGIFLLLLLGLLLVYIINCHVWKKKNNANLLSTVFKYVTWYNTEIYKLKILC